MDAMSTGHMRWSFAVRTKLFCSYFLICNEKHKSLYALAGAKMLFDFENRFRAAFSKNGNEVTITKK